MFPREWIPLSIYFYFDNVQLLNTAMYGNVSGDIASVATLWHCSWHFSKANGHPELVMVALLQVHSNFILQ